VQAAHSKVIGGHRWRCQVVVEFWLVAGLIWLWFGWIEAIQLTGMSHTLWGSPGIYMGSAIHQCCARSEQKLFLQNVRWLVFV